jgi:hypothetical protein
LILPPDCAPSAKPATRENEERSVPEVTTHLADPQLSAPATLGWGADLGLEIRVGSDRAARLCAPAFAAPGSDGVQLSGSLPLVEARFTGETRNASADRSVRTTAGAGLLYQGHEELRDGSWTELRVDLAEPDTGLAASLHLRRPDGVAAFQAHVTLVNGGTRPLVIESVTSFVLGGLTSRTTSEREHEHDYRRDGDPLANFDIWHAARYTARIRAPSSTARVRARGRPRTTCRRAR